MLRQLLALLLVAIAPLHLALTAAAILNSLTDRGWPAVMWLVVRLAVTGFGVAAGRALWSNRRGAMTLARWATGSSLGAVLLTTATSIWPATLPPGVREPAAIATVTWHALWFVWTLRQPTDTASGSSGSGTR